MMQEHHCHSHRARPIKVWESVRELNTGHYGRYFGDRLSSMLKLIFLGTPKLSGKITEARLNDYEESGRFHYGSGM
jgi:hypothetical protein